MAVKPIPRPSSDKMRKGPDWSEGATPGRLAMEEAVQDLALMEVSRR